MYHPATDRYLVLNATAGFLWENLDGERTTDCLARMLSEHYEVEVNQARTDVEELLTLLDAQGLLWHGEGDHE